MPKRSRQLTESDYLLTFAVPDYAYTLQGYDRSVAKILASVRVDHIARWYDDNKRQVTRHVYFTYNLTLSAPRYAYYIVDKELRKAVAQAVEDFVINHGYAIYPADTFIYTSGSVIYPEW
jgi:hypothetical protein